MTRQLTRSLQAAGALGLLLGLVSLGSAAALEVWFEGMAPHVGQRFEARLTEAETGMEVARSRVASIESETFAVRFSGLKPREGYVLDFYVDFNDNGRYDPPPVDHAWRIQVPDYRASMALRVGHNTGFTDIEWPNAEALQEPAIDGRIGLSEYAHYLYDSGTGIRVYWSNDAAVLTVGLISPGTGWVSAGFDPVDAMQGANFVLAAIVDGVLVIEDHYGTSRFGHSIDASQDILEAAGAETEGTTVVEFRIPLDSGDGRDKPLLPGSTYSMLLAYHASSDSLGQRHTKRSTIEITVG